jgi:hypothetical protein
MVKSASKASGKTDQYSAAVELVDQWLKGGAHRLNKDRDDQEDDGNALAVFDSWYTHLVHDVFDDEFGKGGFKFAAPISSFNPETGSSFFFDFSDYLNDVLRGKTRKHLARNYCDNITTPKAEGCSDVVVGALKEALKQLSTDQGDDPSKWTTPAEWIEYSGLGAGSADHIPWQNRGTHNQAVQTGTDAPSPEPSGSSSPAP